MSAPALPFSAAAAAAAASCAASSPPAAAYCPGIFSGTVFHERGMRLFGEVGWAELKEVWGARACAGVKAGASAGRGVC